LRGLAAFPGQTPFILHIRISIRTDFWSKQ